MQRLPILALLAAVQVGLPVAAHAHFHLLIPSAAAVDPGEEVTLTYAFGHPFEHELVAVPPPVALVAHPARGEASALRFEGAPDSHRERHTVRWTPSTRGDHILALHARSTSAETIEESFVKLVVHARSQRGWDRTIGQELEIVPLTRPYGIRPGWTVRARALLGGEPLADAEVEVEKYNSEPPKTLPEDEFVTRTSRTSADGVLLANLDEAGWWTIHVHADGGRAADGRARRLTATWIVWVGEPLRPPTTGS